MMRLLLAMVCLMNVLSMAGQSAADGGVWNVPRVGGENITEPSPEATAMRRYQDYPVSYATGTADISIPLLDLPGGKVGVSLGLRYHTGGIKRQYISTGVGLGWSLTGLGQVSRQVNGLPDEWHGVGYPVINFNLDYGSGDWQYYKKIVTGEIEAQYDRYSYNFPGYSDSFMIVDGAIRQLPKTDLNIQRIADSSNPDATDAFLFTTPDGTKYRFDVKEHVEYTYNPTPGLPSYMVSKNYEAVTTWNLSCITAPQGDDSSRLSIHP